MKERVEKVRRRGAGVRIMSCKKEGEKRTGTPTLSYFIIFLEHIG